MKKIFETAALLTLAMLMGCKTDKVEQQTPADRESLFQVATLQSLMVGCYDGFISVGELRRHGDIGIGTFHCIDGEMTILDGVVYQAMGDGTMRVAPDSVTVPFATATYFDADIVACVPPFEDLQALGHHLDSIIVSVGRNQIYMLQMPVEAQALTVRSEISQTPPFRPLAETMAEAQREFSYENVRGMLVAIYFPPFFKAENTPGWHYHFVSDDRLTGGHVLALKSAAEEMEAELDATPYFHMYLPEDRKFNETDLTPDLSREIKKVEQ